MKIIEDNLQGDEIRQLLKEHHEDMLTHSPEESVHALDIDGLSQPNVTFWTIWSDGKLAGCGALKQLDDTHSEIKSMRTSKTFLRQGVAAKMLTHILEVARQRGYQRVSLETGTPDAFKPARKLYQNFGFTDCPPFGQYQEDPYSQFFTLQLEQMAEA